jgi:transcriptional regulator with PAS, ATPase and Fis domain
MASRRPQEGKTEGVLDNGSRFSALIRAFPTFAADGNVSGFIEVVEDITERIQLEKRLKHSEKQSSMAKSATIIAHEIREPLGAITNSIGAFTKNLKLDQKQQELLQFSIEEVQKVNLIIDEFLAKLGIIDYTSKPFNLDKIKLKKSRIQEEKGPRKEKDYLLQKVQSKYYVKGILGHSENMQNIFKMVAKISNSDASVLIMGESGTGKELIAKTIHNNSSRKKNPLISINCSALPRELLESELFGHLKGSFTGASADKKGLLEEANGGTFFLDEVGDLDPAIQAKLLRVLQDGSFRRLGGNKENTVNVRFISATNKNLEEAVDKGDFRQDLFYRLNVFKLWLPPLRERKEDIPLLATHFLQKSAQKLGVTVEKISKDALSQLVNHSWPGNVRELENVIEHAAIVCDGQTIFAEDLPLPINSFQDQDNDNLNTVAIEENVLDMAERESILRVLRECGYNKRKTAKELGISETTLWRKLKKHGIFKAG